MSVCYLEVDDEITSAIGRIRAVRDNELVIVVPPGSRIATSRINFKLLAREAAQRNVSAVAVSDEPQVRALAVAAGLPAYDSLASAEQALASFRDQDRRLAERLGATDRDTGTPTRAMRSPAAPRAPADAGDDTAVLPAATTAVLPAAAAARAQDVSAPRAHATTRRRGRPPIGVLIAVALLGLLVAGVAYGAYVFLPTAEITLRPAAIEIRPPVFAVTADPNVAVVDAVAGIIPAQAVAVPLHVEDLFPATGILARETRASGIVRFRSENTVEAVMIPAGTIVSTADGIDFETTRTVSVPRADFATSTPGTVDAQVRAVRGGPRGNVDANAVSDVPAALRAQLVTVRNPEPMRGGERIEETVVSEEDYTTALAALEVELEAALAAALSDPGTIPRGLVAFPQTASLGEATPDTAAGDVVGMAMASFSLAMDASAEVVAVNETLLEEVGAARVRAELTPGRTLVADEVVVTHDAGTVIGQTILYNVTASAWSFDRPDTAQVLAQIRGRSVAEARATLARYGEAEIAVWPDFVDRLPDQPSRISLVVEQPAVAP